MLLLYNEAQAWASVFQKKFFVVILFGGGEGRNFGFVLTRYGEPMNKFIEGRTMS
jgi:hypothetical protein